MIVSRMNPIHDQAVSVYHRGPPEPEKPTA
jgi:hypothetical protein